jgi:hypothetical protein
MELRSPGTPHEIGLLLLPALLVPALLLNTACGGVGSNPDFELGVPYHAQDPGSLDCGPASVQMWADYDFSNPPSQAQISQWMGGTSCGVSQSVIADAVNYFTATTDAYWDFVGSNEQDQFISRQITSIDNRTPVIAIITFNHAGVINGGKWHEISSGYQWDYVYFHDPNTLPNDYYSSEFWLDVNCPTGSPCEQIISTSASGAWGYNYNTYGGSVWDSGGEQPTEENRDV